MNDDTHAAPEESSFQSPPWSGWIETTGDALLILEAARRGLIPRVTRRLFDSERQGLIASGSVFVFRSDESGIKRWTDGFRWSPPRALGNFRLYREVVRKLDTWSFYFKADGLVKKTLSLKAGGLEVHLISYYRIPDVECGRLRTPSSCPELASLDISPSYLERGQFRYPPKVKVGIDGVPRYRGEYDEVLECRVGAELISLAEVGSKTGPAEVGWQGPVFREVETQAQQETDVEMIFDYNHIRPLEAGALDAVLGAGRLEVELEVDVPSAEYSSAWLNTAPEYYLGPWFEIHRHFASYVLEAASPSLKPELREVSKCWADWDILTSLANYHSTVKFLLKYLESKDLSDLTDVVSTHISVQLAQDVSLVLGQMMFILHDSESYHQFLASRGDLAQQLLDLIQDLLDLTIDVTPKSSLCKALFRLSDRCGLHPTCFGLFGLQKVGQQIAGGGFGDIWKGFVGDQTVAIKSMRLFQDDDVQAVLKKFGREALVWRQLSHPNLLPFFGLYTMDSRLCLVSPWMENGDLHRFIKRAPSAYDRVSLIVDVATGLEYLHKNHVVHGDLKAPNILVTPSGRACIADFGLSSIFTDVTTLRFTPSNQSAQGGTPRYQAPELLRGAKKHFQSDVYAFAGVCYEILTGKVPFFEMANDMAVIIAVNEGNRPSRPDTILTDLWKLLEDCWAQKPDDRPTATQITQRLFSSSIAPEIRQFGSDWDETCSARFRRAVQYWPLLPSVTEIQLRISRHTVFTTEGLDFFESRAASQVPLLDGQYL